MDVFITPDGPRGPAYELGPGIIFLAQKSGAAVLPMNMEYSSCWRVKAGTASFCQSLFPQCGSSSGRRITCVRRQTEEEFERERLRLQDAMMQLVERK